MLRKIRTGDILLAEDKKHGKTQMYLIGYDTLDGYMLICLSCGERIGCYKHNKDALLNDIKGFLHVIQVVPKEVVAEFIEKTYKPALKVQCHDICEEHELGIELEME